VNTETSDSTDVKELCKRRRRILYLLVLESISATELYFLQKKNRRQVNTIEARLADLRTRINQDSGFVEICSIAEKAADILLEWGFHFQGNPILLGHADRLVKIGQYAVNKERIISEIQFETWKTFQIH